MYDLIQLFFENHELHFGWGAFVFGIVSFSGIFGFIVSESLWDNYLQDVYSRSRTEYYKRARLPNFNRVLYGLFFLAPLMQKFAMEKGSLAVTLLMCPIAFAIFFIKPALLGRAHK